MIRTSLAILLATALSAPAVAQRTCTVTSYGKGCGPVYTGQVTPNGNTHRALFTVSNVAPGSRILIFVGAQKIDFDLKIIFGGNLDCRLLTTINFMQQHVAMHDGTYTFGHALPSTFLGTAYTQAAVLVPNSTPEVLTSNAVELTCK